MQAPENDALLRDVADPAPPSRAADAAGHAGEQRYGRKGKAKVASTLMDNPISILVGCEENDCGAKSRVVIDNASPRSLHYVGRFFLARQLNVGLHEINGAFPVAVAGRHSRLGRRCSAHEAAHPQALAPFCRGMKVSQWFSRAH